MKRREGRRSAALFALLAAACPLPAYYHFIHYLNGANAPEKFDLSALNSNTVVVLVSEAGPSAYSATDSFNSVVNQILQATKVWDGVSSSALRVHFGGLENTATARNIPGVDCVFEDLPPGLLGYGGPTALDAAVTAADNSRFIPITRSAMHLNLNLTIAPGPSYNESFFTTAVHEMGHTLGLQHTFTSATMSTATTRATNLTHPLGADDIAGISLLYPNSLASNYGSITGKITAAGKPVHLQSVVAIRPGGDAVSDVTNPDGSYAITGLPPGDYYVYAHPLPPDADIDGPWDSNGNLVPASAPTNTLFYPATTSLGDAQTVTVAAGAAVSGINLSLSPRSVVDIYDVGVYSFFNSGKTAVKPADLNVNNGPVTVSVSSIGLGASGQAQGFGVQFMGGNIQLQPGGLQPYLSSGYTYIGLTLGFIPNPSPGPQHVAFTTSNDMYVLPNAISLTQSDPPSITAASPNPDGSVTVTGANWAPDTLFYFDSLPATVNSLDPESGSAVLTPPPPAGSQTATLSAYNFDGQNSQLIAASAPVTYSFPAAAAPAIASIAPATLPAGSEAMVDVTATGIDFIDGSASLGFGTPDILVRRVFVLSPTHVVADVSVLPGAAQTASDVSVLSGFQIATASAAFLITAPVPGLPAAVPLLFNGISGLTGSYAGAIVAMYGQNLDAPGGAPALQIAGKTALIKYASPGQINLQIPSDLPPGPALLTLNNGVADALPVIVNIDTPPAGIGAIQRVSGAYIYAGHPAMLGETLIVSLTNFAPPNSTVALNRVQVGVGGVLRAPSKIVAATATDFQVWFPLTQADATGSSVQVVVYLDGRSSYPAQIPIVAPPAN